MGEVSDVTEFVRYEGQAYKDCYRPLDNICYANCTFEGVTFLYSGGPFRFESCRGDRRCRLVVQGAAHNTARLFEQFWPALGQVPPAIGGPPN